AEAEDADLLAVLLRHGADPALDLLAVARQDRVEDRQGEVQRLRLVRERANVLGKARAPEGEAGLEVVGGEIELRVLAEDLHEPMAVQTQALADVADLVREADLQRVPRVVRVLHHLRGLVVGADERARKVAIKFRDDVTARAIKLADDGL